MNLCRTTSKRNELKLIAICYLYFSMLLRFILNQFENNQKTSECKRIAETCAENICFFLVSAPQRNTSTKTLAILLTFFLGSWVFFTFPHLNQVVSQLTSNYEKYFLHLKRCLSERLSFIAKKLPTFTKRAVVNCHSKKIFCHTRF